MKRHIVTPYDYMRLGFDVWRLSVEASMVIGFRMMGMAGTWNTAKGEDSRMVDEKPLAFAQAGMAAAVAASKGANPVQIAAAAIVPLQRRTRANAARLAKRGPRWSL